MAEPNEIPMGSGYPQEIPLEGNGDGTADPAPASGVVSPETPSTRDPSWIDTRSFPISHGFQQINGAIEKMTNARANGYDWDEIDGQLADFRSEANRFGYSDGEVDEHLGYQDTLAAYDRTAAGWHQQMASDPALTEKILDAPTLSSWQEKSQETPDSILHPSVGFKPTPLMTGNIMDDYARALLSGEVKGPDDFADLAAKTFYGAMDFNQPGGQYDTIRGRIMDNLAQAQAQLKATLPNPREVIDTSLAVAQQADIDPSFGMVSNIQRNLMQHWQDTGERPMTAFQRAMNDPALQAKLTGAPYTEGPDIWGSVGRIWSATKLAEKVNWSDLGRDFDFTGLGNEMNRQNNAGNPLGATMLGVAGIAMGGFNGMQRVFGAMLMPQVAGWTQLVSEFSHSPNTPEESVIQVPELVNMLGAVGSEIGFMHPQITAAKANIRVGAPVMAQSVADLVTANAKMLMGDQFPKGVQPPQMLDFGDSNLFKQARAHDLAPQPPMTGTVFAHEPLAVGPVSAEGTVEKTQHQFDIRDADGGNVAQVTINKEGANASVVHAPRVWFPGVVDVARKFFQDNPEVGSIDGWQGRSPTGVALTRDQVMQKPAAALEALGATPHEVVQQTVQDALGRPGSAQAFDAALKAVKDNTGNFFQNALEKAGASPAGITLAKSYDTAAGMYGIFRNILSDESGALRIANPVTKNTSVFTAVDDILSRIGQNPARDAAQRLINMKLGLMDQYKQRVMRELTQHTGTLDKYKDAYDTAIRSTGGNLLADPLHILNRYVDGRSPWTLAPNDPLTPIADAIKNIHDDLWTQMTQRLGKDGALQWYNNHYRFLFERPALVDRAFMGKQLKQAPTLSEGIERGLMPNQVNPVMARIDEINHLGNFLAQYDVIDAAKHLVMPSGLPLAIKSTSRTPTPVGYSAIAGQSNLYAPEGFANTYNRFFNKAYAQDALGSSIADKIMHFTNALTGLKLAFPTYHAQAIAQEAMMANIAIGFGKIAHGEMLKGLGRLLSGTNPISSVAQLIADGRKVQRDYFEKNMAGDPVATLFAEARGRAAGRQSIYKYAGGASYLEELANFKGFGDKTWGWAGNRIDNLKNATFKQAGETVPEYMAKMPFRVVANTFSEGMKVFSYATGADFLFDRLIPQIKMGAFGGEMQMFLDHNPLSSNADRLEHANRLIDSMDNRFGELNQDRLFWPSMAKKVLNLSLVSLGWEYGSLRAFANAIPGAQGAGYTGRTNAIAMRWLLGFGIGTAIMNNVYQYAKTGKPSWQTNSPVLDNFLARNGGTVTNSHVTAPDRTVLPGYEKDVFNAGKIMMTNPINDPVFGKMQGIEQLMMSKLNPALQIAKMMVTGEDGIGHVIRDIPVHGHSPKTIGEVAENYMKAIGEEALPILFNSIAQRKKGTGISKVENILGYRTGPPYLTNPVGFEKGLENRENALKRQELGRAKSEQSQLESPDETFPPSGGNSNPFKDKSPFKNKSPFK